MSNTAPLILLLLPLDALCLLCDGVLLAGEQSAYTARASILAALVGCGMLFCCNAFSSSTLFTIWVCLRLFMLSKCVMVAHRVFGSRLSPFRVLPVKAVAEADSSSGSTADAASRAQ